ncbi:MAG: hypothetical protein U1C33_06845, partial [Candidatus Cloacimonadaceae bacterium]|nr:hypothetical protein [Candidatus Cloacimonadaceae bacterium]
HLPTARLEDIDSGWFTEHGNLGRTAHRNLPNWGNEFQSTSIFVSGEVYIYPNPLKSIYKQQVNLNVMTNRDTEVSSISLISAEP